MKLRPFLIVAGFFLILLAILLFPFHTARAAGGTLTASSTEIVVGDSVTLTVTVSGDNIGGFSAVLSNGIVVANADGKSDSGTFTPSSAGTYVISASGTIALTNLEEVSFTTNSVTITVKEPAPTQTTAPTPTPTPTPSAKPGTTPDPNATEPPEKTPIPEEGDTATPAPTEDTRPYVHTSEGDIFIALKFPENIVLPAGCEKNSAVIKNRYVEAFSLGGNNYLVVYTTDKDGNNGQLRIFDRDTDSFVKPVSSTIPASEYRIYSLSDTMEAPEHYVPDSILISGETIRVFRDTTREGFYLVLAQDETGLLGFYLYDEVQQTLQRYIDTDEHLKTTLPTPEPVPEETQSVLAEVEEQYPGTSSVNVWKVVAIIAMLCSICLLGALSVLLFLNRKKNSDAASAEEAVMKDLLKEDPSLNDADPSVADPLDDPFGDLFLASVFSSEEDIFRDEKDSRDGQNGGNV